MGKQTLHLAGAVVDNGFYQAKACLDYLKESKDVDIDVQSMPEPVFEQFVANQAQKFKTKDGQRHARLTGGSCMVWKGEDEYIGGIDTFLAWAKKTYGYEDKTPRALYKKRTAAGLTAYIQSFARKHKFAYLDLTIGLEPPRRIIIELFWDQVPKTCDNFLGLCEPSGDKFGYANTAIHRAVKGAWIQGGDVRNGDGDGGYSIYGKYFEDENFALRHTWAGDVAMANSGPHTNGSQFYIATQALPWLDKKKVVFGRVLSGLSTVRRIERLPTERWNQRSNPQVTVVGCGAVDPENWRESTRAKAEKDIDAAAARPTRERTRRSMAAALTPPSGGEPLTNDEEPALGSESAAAPAEAEAAEAAETPAPPPGGEEAAEQPPAGPEDPCNE